MVEGNTSLIEAWYHADLEFRNDMAADNMRRAANALDEIRVQNIQSSPLPYDDLRVSSDIHSSDIMALLAAIAPIVGVITFIVGVMKLFLFLIKL